MNFNTIAPQVFQVVRTQAIERGCAQELLEVLQCLLLVPHDANASVAVWSALSECCQTIVAQPDQAEAGFLAFENLATVLEELKQQVLSDTRLDSDALCEPSFDNVSHANAERDLSFAGAGLTALAVSRTRRHRSVGSRRSVVDASELRNKESALEAVIQRNRELESAVQRGDTNVAQLSAKVSSLQAQLEQARKQGRGEGVAQTSESGVTPNLSTSLAAGHVLDPRYHKYQRMLAAGLPMTAVLHAATRDGIDTEKVESALLAQQQTPQDEHKRSESETTGTMSDTAVPDKHEKYRGMLKNHLPEAAVLHAMKRDGIASPSIEMLANHPCQPQQQANNTAAPSTSTTAAPADSAGVSQRHFQKSSDVKYNKYKMMLKQGLPMAAVENAMMRDGVDVAEAMAKPAPVALPLTWQQSEDPKYDKYKKMLKMGLPLGAVENAMGKDGVERPSDSCVNTNTNTNITDSSNVPPAKAPKPAPASSVPLRTLFWSKIPDTEIDGTLWDELTKEEEEEMEMGIEENEGSDTQTSTTGLLDLKTIESLFAKKPAVAVLPSSKLEQANNQSDTQSVLKLLDPKRQQSVGIGLAGLRLPHPDIKAAVLAMNANVLGGASRVLTLKRLIPNIEEAIAVKANADQAHRLGKVEQYFLLMSSIPSLGDRIDAWCFQLGFDAQRAEAAQALEVVKAAVEQVRSSSAWRKLLQIVLSVGNFLNGGNAARGGAYGFRMDTLTKLEAFKTGDNRTNLLVYVAQEIVKPKCPHVLDVLKEVRS
jgi:hypothetical protein